MPSRLAAATMPFIATRRTFVQSAVAAGAAIALPPLAWPAASAGADTLITKPIPKTGERLPVIGLGTIWYRDANYATLKPVIQRLIDLGGTLIDTAASYGESEGVVGRALADLGLRNKAFVATKFTAGQAQPAAPPANVAAAEAQRRGPGPGGVDGPPPGIERPIPDGVGGQASFERSLQRLRTDHVDLLQVHNVTDAEGLMPQMLEWKQARKIRYLGVSAAAAQPERLAALMKKFPLDFVQLDYSLGNRAADDGALQACQDHGAAVLINLPLGRNGLLRKAQGKPVPPWAAELGISTWAQFFLKWVVSHPAVTCAIPGTSNVQHLEDDLRAARGVLPNAAQRLRMTQAWDSVG